MCPHMKACWLNGRNSIKSTRYVYVSPHESLMAEWQKSYEEYKVCVCVPTWKPDGSEILLRVQGMYAFPHESLLAEWQKSYEEYKVCVCVPT